MFPVLLIVSFPFPLLIPFSTNQFRFKQIERCQLGGGGRGKKKPIVASAVLPEALILCDIFFLIFFPELASCFTNSFSTF